MSNYKAWRWVCTTRRVISDYLHAASWKTRVFALVVLLAAAAVVVVVASLVSAFPSGYANAQSRAACSLPTEAHALADLRAGTTSDLLVFIPVYIVVALGAVVITTRVKADEPVRCALKRWILSDALAVFAVLVLCLADVIETLRFRHALLQLRAGAACGSLSGYTHLTGRFTCLKIAMIVVVLGLVAARVICPVTTTGRPEDAPLADT